MKPIMSELDGQSSSGNRLNIADLYFVKRSREKMIEPAELMQLAIDACREGVAAGQSPFGCAIAIGRSGDCPIVQYGPGID